jgi:hypothetical protein
MLKTTLKCASILTIIAMFIGLAGCILNPKDDKVPPSKPTYVYLDLTHKDDPIKNLVTAYKEHNVAPIEKLLHSLYIWRNQDLDVQNHNLPESYSRSEEITSTTNMFLAADKRSEPDKYIDKLELIIEDGSWLDVSEFQGQPCDDCWETTREYLITVVMEGGNTTLQGNDLVVFTIVPVTEGGKKLYKIGRADDRAK